MTAKLTLPQRQGGRPAVTTGMPHAHMGDAAPADVITGRDIAHRWCEWTIGHDDPSVA